jgi:RNA polymerase sigma-70 factor (ECF subfamily)
MTAALQEAALETLSDVYLAARATARDPRAIRLVTERNNQRLFRAAWSILRNRQDAEEVVQETYCKAFTGKAPFTGQSALSTWLTRIAINEALARLRAAQAQKRALEGSDVAVRAEYRDLHGASRGAFAAPDREVFVRELAKTLETAIAALPEDFRLVFVLRAVEQMSVEETAEAAGILPQTVKTRYLRARGRLREALGPDIRAALDESFRFAGADCARLTANTLQALCGDQPQA